MPTHKIAIVGPESTGKSWLTEQLRRHYNSLSVPEMAREYLNNLQRDYRESDLKKIAALQCKTEDDQLKKHPEYLICDTTLLVIKIWSTFKYNSCDTWIVEEEKKRQYDFYLLTDIDLAWEDDPLREHPDKRRELFSIFYRSLIRKGVAFAVIFGSGEERQKRAIRAVEAAIRK